MSPVAALMLLAVLSIVLLTGAGPALANPGSLDPTFGAHGVTYLPQPTGIPTAGYDKLAEAPGGDLYALGGVLTSTQPCGIGNGTDCDSAKYFVAALTPDGHLNRSFGTAGVLDLGFIPSALAVTRNGDVVLAGGTSEVEPEGAVVPTASEIMELTPTGEPNASFGTDGVAQLPSPGDQPQALAVEPDGDLVVTGQTSASAFFAARMMPTGAIDPSFGHDGTFTEQLGTGTDPSSAGTDVVPGPTGDLVFTVSSNTDPNLGFALVELTAAGAPDPSFRPTAFSGVPGVVFLQDPTQVVSQPGGRGYVVTGDGKGPSGQQVPVAVRFHLNGTLDTGFGRGGVYVGASNASVGGLVARPDGLLDLAPENVGLPGPLAIIQLGVNGAPDGAFGPNGVARQPLPGEGADDAVLDAAGDLVVLGPGSAKGSYVARVQLPAASLSLTSARTSRAHADITIACHGSSQTTCATTLTLMHARRTVAERRVSVQGRKSSRVALMLDRRARRLLRRERRLVVSLRIGTRRSKMLTLR